MERGIPGILIFEDLVDLSPYMHTPNDIVGTSLNDDALFLANVKAAAATLFTLARPIHPPEIALRVRRDPGDPPTTVRLEWTGGFPPYNVHRRDIPQDVAEDTYVVYPEVRDATRTDDDAAGSLLFYSIEEYP